MSGLLGGKKTPQTKLGNACRSLADDIRKDGLDVQAHQLERAGANLDQAAISLGARGDRVKTLGNYYAAIQLFNHVAAQVGRDKYEG